MDMKLQLPNEYMTSIVCWLHQLNFFENYTTLYNTLSIYHGSLFHGFGYTMVRTMDPKCSILLYITLSLMFIIPWFGYTIFFSTDPKNHGIMKVKCTFIISCDTLPGVFVDFNNTWTTGSIYCITMLQYTCVAYYLQYIQ